jgi:CHAD domain-containing protein/CYTH domain-containing protein
MKGAAALLDLAAPRAARFLALGFLREAHDARGRLNDEDDAEALHDFRVALRRLRSTLRAYADHMTEAVRGRDRRRLRKLAHATGDSRDGEVMIEWVQTRGGHLADDARPGVAWLLNVLRRQQTGLGEALREEVARDFARERKRLGRRLKSYTAHVSVDDPREAPRMAGVLADLVALHAAELRDRLNAVTGVELQHVAHRGRIAAKRLRYLLEPFAGEVEDAASIVRRLKVLQEVLGQMHDADVAAELVESAREAVEHAGEHPDPVPGLDALVDTAHAEVEARYAEVEEEWLHGRADAFFADVERLVAVLRGGGEDREIERKYLLRGMPALPEGAVRTEIIQGYIPGERLNERVRRVRRNGQSTYYRTVKMGTGLNRMEVEEETTEAIFRRLWRLTRGKRVRKLRFRVEQGEFTWEIDQFRDRALVLAEIELPAEDTEVHVPDWLRDHVERDVTGESEYVNLNLAR